MRDMMSHVLSTLTPFSDPAQLPLIAYGNGRRVIRYLVSPANSKGLIEVETLPDLMDRNGGKPLRFKIAPGKTPIVGWYTVDGLRKAA